MIPKILKTEAEYEAALMQVQKLMHAEPGTPEGERFESWAKLVEDYENIHYPIEPPDPVAAAQFRWEQENPLPEPP